MVDTKQELKLAQMFFCRALDIAPDSITAQNGDPTAREPDVVIQYNAQEYGIELGALASTEAMKYDDVKTRFLDALDERLRGQIPDTWTVQLNLQFDKDAIVHKSSASAGSYTYLPKYLDGLFVVRGGNPPAGGRIVSMQESSRIPDDLFPSLRLGKEFDGLVNELIQLVNGLQDQDFWLRSEDSDIETCFICLADLDRRREGYTPADLVLERFSASIQDKLKNKYQGEYDAIFLVFHNHGVGSTDMHFYWHWRTHIVIKLAKLCFENKTFQEYGGIFFLDFTHYHGQDPFNLYKLDQQDERVLVYLKDHYAAEVSVPLYVDFSEEPAKVYVKDGVRL